MVMSRIFCTLLFLLAAFGLAQADIIINEVMSNELGANVSLEWIELYNNSDSAKSLLFYSLDIDGVSLTLPGISLGPYQYYIACRRLYDSATVIGFESVWGDGSGLWGDTPQENYQVHRLAELALRNDSGTIILKYASIAKSIFHWTSAGQDGVSWERFAPTSLVISNSFDPRGGTPGRINSSTPRQDDLALLKISAYPESDNMTGLNYLIANIGLQPVSGAALSIYYDNNEDSIVADSDFVVIFNLPDMAPGDTIARIENLHLRGTYATLLARLPQDDRPANNLVLLTAPGEYFPPIILSEFLADPQSPLRAEWVEIKNRSDSTINIKGWLLGDSARQYQITALDYFLSVGEYLVLCDDSSAFKSFYTASEIPLLQMSGWASLNNNGDKIRLTDSFGFVADSFLYSLAYGDNYTWGRGGEVDITGRWGRSVSPGGTPGQGNEVYYQASASKIEIKVEPNPFSPREDGEMVITFAVPPGDNLSMRLYDTEGRVVKTLLDKMPALDGTVRWNGSSEAGRRLPVGIYILFVEVYGREQYKQTVVIAP